MLPAWRNRSGEMPRGSAAIGEIRRLFLFVQKPSQPVPELFLHFGSKLALPDNKVPPPALGQLH